MPDRLHIDAERLTSDLDQLSRIGRDESSGIHRTAFSRGDQAGRAWFSERMEDAGFQVRTDGAANLGTRWPPDLEGPCVMTGSHLDTVPGAGQLDGTLGVLCGLEVLRVLAENEIEVSRPIELVSFSDEEGRFGGMLGSQAISGQLTPAMIEQAADLEGVQLVDAMAECGFRALDALAAERRDDSIYAFIELHIEQGPVLEHNGVGIGLVEAITGLFRWEVRLIGEPNHAGTTPMDLRRDAFQAMAEFAAEIDRILEEHGSPRSRATIGRVELVPGAANVVPGEARFAFEVRDTDEQVLVALGDAFRRTLSAIARRRDVGFEFEVLSTIEPVRCHERVMAAIEKSCQQLSISPFRLPSGAAHDTQMIARKAPAGMIFVPSRGGRSHSPAEWTALADIERGANVLLHSILELAR